MKTWREGGSVDTKREGEDRDPGPPTSDVRDSSSGGRDKTKRMRWHRGQVRKLVQAEGGTDCVRCCWRSD